MVSKEASEWRSSLPSLHSMARFGRLCSASYWASMKVTLTWVRMGTLRPSTVKGL